MRKVLGQAYPDAGVLLGLYVVPDDKQAVCSTVTACNRGTTKADIRVSVAVDGAEDTDKQYVLDTDVSAKRTFAGTIGMTLGAGDIVRVYSSTGRVAFNLFGSESDA